MIDILLPSFVLVLIIILMHTYLGIEIIKRQIIFTDIAVGQMAALGTAISLVFLNEKYHFLFSILFAVLTAIIIAYVSKKNKYVEAFIGIFYAFGFSSLFIVLSKSPSGMEHIKELTASDILYVDFKDVFITFFIYLIFLSILYFSKSYKYYEFIYFPVFALTIVHSVSLVGVLVVFTFLIVPAFIGFLVKKEKAFIIGIASGFILSVFAIYLAVKFDFPVGYTITSVLSFFAILLAIIK